MVYAPGHFRQLAQPRRRRGRERMAVHVGALVSVALVAVVIFSLTSGAGRVAHGCVSFTYTTMIGGGQMHRCGAQARALCASRPSSGGVDGSFSAALVAACRRAHLPGGH
jgi:hypothetical protein